MTKQMMLEGVFAFYKPEELLEFLHERYGAHLKLELGPGRRKERLPHASLGLNPSADPLADLWWDLNEGLPFPDNCLDEIVSNQTLEHIRKENFIYLMNEFNRCLKSGGRMKHCVPHYLSPWADGDPSHYNRFSPESFRYFCTDEDGLPFVQRFSDYGIECAFVLEKQVVRDRLDITVWLRKP